MITTIVLLLILIAVDLSIVAWTLLDIRALIRGMK